MKFNFKSARSPDPALLPAAVLALIRECEKLKTGDLVDARELSALISRSENIVAHHVCHSALADYRHKINQRVYYGNKATIAEFKKQHP